VIIQNVMWEVSKASNVHVGSDEF